MSELFADRYDIQHELGRGAFGVVYLAHDVRLRGRPVALKVLHPALSTDPQVVRLFENEAGILAALRHDQIITVYDVGVWELRRYIVMDYVAGPSLAQVVKEQGAQPPQRVQAWLRQAAEALACAHGQGVLHRDVKSANLLLETARDRLFVGDFGLARAAEASGGSSVQSEAHLLTGTAAYRAPEVHRTGHSVASDLYGLGVVGYELLAGRRPFESDDPLSLMLLHATEPVPPLPAATPAPLTELVISLLAKDPAQRPADAQAVAEALARMTGSRQRKAESEQVAVDVPSPAVAPLLVDLPPLAPPAAPPPPPASSDSSQGRRPQGWLGWLAAGVALVAVLLLGLWMLNGPRGANANPSATPAPPVATLAPTDTPALPTIPPLPPTDTPIPAPPTDTPQPTPTLGIGSTMISEIDGMEYVYVPAGEFLMGSTGGDEMAQEDEKPQHTVYLDGYWIARTEVTNAMFARFVRATGYQTEAEKAGSGRVFKFVTAEFEETPDANWRHPRGTGSNLVGLNYHPVVQVSWNDAVAYCQWAGCRLPTEAEWEKAARGVDGRLYPWGNGAVSGNRLNFADANLVAPWADKSVNDGYTFTAPVGSYPAGASPYGALDMAGNVWEWVADWYEKNMYTQAPRENPQGPENGSMRVLRGGAWSYTAQAARTSDRSSVHLPDFRSGPIGFRPVRTP